MLVCAGLNRPVKTGRTASWGPKHIEIKQLKSLLTTRWERGDLCNMTVRQVGELLAEVELNSQKRGRPKNYFTEASGCMVGEVVP